MSDPEIVNTQNEPDDAAIAAEVAELTASPADQQAEKIKNALITAKRDLRVSNRRVKELEPVAARASEIDERLNSAQPVINAILSNPKLRAEALRIASGTHASAETTAQPAADDDPDAAAFAEDAGFFLGDNVTPDVARARRVLSRLDQRHGRQTDERIRPLAGVTLSQKAEANLREAMAQTDQDGVPYATQESIREVAGQLPPQLLADPKVVDLVLNSAIGIDRRKHRTPKAPDEPLYLAPAGGGRRAEPAISSDEKRLLARFGIDEKTYKESSATLEKNVASRRGTQLE